MLRQDYKVKVCHHDIRTKLVGKVVSFLAYNLDVLLKILWTDVVIVNFGSWHTIFPVLAAKLTGKKSIILLGGFDAGNIPSLGYGVFYKKGILRMAIVRIYKIATYLCPVSEAMIKSVNAYADPTGKGYKTGILSFVPDAGNKINVISTDYDGDFWKPDSNRKPEGILALAFVHDEKTFRLKGFDLLTECAKNMPEFRFTFAGFTEPMESKYRNTLPTNVKLTGTLSAEGVKALYQSHKVYILPSLSEGLPNTLCEAMLCGCIPVGSEVGGIPEVIGDTGIIVSKRKTETIMEALKRAAGNSEYDPYFARQRILARYPKGSRMAKLKALVEEEW